MSTGRGLDFSVVCGRKPEPVLEVVASETIAEEHLRKVEKYINEILH
jgi:hypothetical protein